MRVVVQRVKHSSVAVDGNIVGKINEGLLILLGIKNGDTEKDVTWLANKVVSLRIFEDENGKMNKELKEINGSILLISQFTLYGDCVKGKRPSFIEAAKPEIAIPLYEKFIDTLKNQGINVETGIFGADMKVELLNDGPVTLVIDSI
ncbi:MAG: D-tyrosyl-tRNA(Tyr) deacylase [Fusobacteriaceae bacterium]|nr:D-tyrosyl-tRNA(Tyr) deacylase [Fusobacteriaceae bacterium]MBP9510383.1 D-tyrosyl-tRNA(Tyr) deacylase [Fusobacteriaceae bacterium]